MLHSTRDDEELAWLEDDVSVPQLNGELALDHEEELAAVMVGRVAFDAHAHAHALEPGAQFHWRHISKTTDRRKLVARPLLGARGPSHLNKTLCARGTRERAFRLEEMSHQEDFVARDSAQSPAVADPMLRASENLIADDVLGWAGGSVELLSAPRLQQRMPIRLLRGFLGRGHGSELDETPR